MSYLDSFPIGEASKNMRFIVCDIKLPTPSCFKTEAMKMTPANEFTKFLSLIAKCSMVMTMRSAIPLSWPFMTAIGVTSLPIVRKFTLNNLPSPLALVLRQIGIPAMLLLVTDHFLKFTRPGAYRTMKLWQRMLPIYVVYRNTKSKIEKAKAAGKLTQSQVERIWMKQHKWGADRVYDMVLENSGYIVKVAQILASKSDLMPDPWVQRLSHLFEGMPPRPWREIKTAMDREVPNTKLSSEMHQKDRSKKINYKSVFESVEEKAVASASIAQVHVAYLNENASCHLNTYFDSRFPIALKIQHSNIKNLMYIDLNNSETIAKFLKKLVIYDVRPFIRELREVVPREFDFLREARLLDAMKYRLSEAPELDQIKVPRVLLELCTEKMLAMEFIEGLSLSKLYKKIKNNPELRKSVQNILPTLIKAYGKMILFDGLFHGDPHPGNIILTPEGKFVLVDFGQCKALTFERQIALAKLIIALNNHGESDIVKTMADLGMTFSGMQGMPPDVEDIEKLAIVLFDTQAIPEAYASPFDKAEGHLLKKLQINDFPQDLWMVCRVVILLRGICHELKVDIKAYKLWRSYAEALLMNKREGWDRYKRNMILDMGCEPADMTMEMPSEYMDPYPSPSSSSSITDNASHISETSGLEREEAILTEEEQEQLILNEQQLIEEMDRRDINNDYYYPNITNQNNNCHANSNDSAYIPSIDDVDHDVNVEDNITTGESDLTFDLMIDNQEQRVNQNLESNNTDREGSVARSDTNCEVMSNFSFKSKEEIEKYLDELWFRN